MNLNRIKTPSTPPPAPYESLKNHYFMQKNLIVFLTIIFEVLKKYLLNQKEYNILFRYLPLVVIPPPPEKVYYIYKR